MGALPQPDLAPGPGRELNDALHELHHRAGWPSLRTLARGAGCSHTTISTVFSSPKLPSWGVLEVLIEALGGDTATFHDLWLAASSPTVAPRTSARIAGRREELAVVRRHLESGVGLLLITGEAGIGKTKLVTTAASGGGANFVATGACLPLSSEVPLLPVANILRQVYERDDGSWMAQSLRSLRPHIRGPISLLIPDLVTEDPVLPERGDEWARQRMFVAIEQLMRALASQHGLSLIIEDLHWADTVTLDLLEHLLTRPGVPIIGTWRIGDLGMDPLNADWFNRVRRLPTVTELPLAMMTKDETAEQLAGLVGRVPSEAVIDAIYLRTQGQPLFTEQLAALEPMDGPLPPLLSDLLDARLGNLVGAAWAAARALGVADRPLTATQLVDSTGLTESEVADALRYLAGRRLTARTSNAQAALRHPLLADAIRRRFVAGEAEAQHARVALALGSSEVSEPAEIARHWQAAGDSEQELAWRIRSAHAAHNRFALAHEADQWLRVLELWPPGTPEVGAPPLRRFDAIVAALEVLSGTRRELAGALARESLTLLPHLGPGDAADLMQRAGEYADALGDQERGLELVRGAISLHETLPPSVGFVLALDGLQHQLGGMGRLQEASDASRRALDIAASLGEPVWHRMMLVERARYDAMEGDVAAARSRLHEAAQTEVLAGPDPRGEIRLAADHTDILLGIGAAVEEIISVGERGLDAAASWDIENYGVGIIRCNMAQALRRAGLVSRAARLVEPFTAERPQPDRWEMYEERAHADLLRGRLEAAVELATSLEGIQMSRLDLRLERADFLVTVALWTGRPERAYDLAIAAVEETAKTELVIGMGRILAMAARAAADLGLPRDAHDRLTGLRDSCASDPFAPGVVPADARAWALTWTAELSRLAGHRVVEPWVAATSAWDDLTRPHDSAYSRWRAAQVARQTGQGSLADRLLKRASVDAREHVPLHQAIALTIARTH